MDRSGFRSRFADGGEIGFRSGLEGAVESTGEIIGKLEEWLVMSEIDDLWKKKVNQY